MTRFDFSVVKLPAVLVVLLISGCGDQDRDSLGLHEHEGEGHSSERGEVRAGDESHESDEHEGDEHEGELRLSAAAIDASGIVVAPLARRALTGGAGLPAELSFDPLSTAHVAPLASGRFRRVEVTLGQRVSAGQLLAIVTSGSASEAGSRLTETRARLAAAETALQRHRELVEQGIGAQRALIEAEAEVSVLRAEAQSLARQLGVLGSSRTGHLRLQSPISGVVTAVHATPGERASTEQAAFTIADPTAISVYGQVPELSISELADGLNTVFRPHAFPELTLHGTIQYIAPAIDPATRSLTVRVALDELDPRLRSGMYGTLELVGENLRALAIPTRAIVTVDGTPTAFVPGHEEGEFVPVPVQIGRRAGTFYEVLGGLSEGDLVVVSGAFTLKSAMSTDELAEHEH